MRTTIPRMLCSIVAIVGLSASASACGVTLNEGKSDEAAPATTTSAADTSAPDTSAPDTSEADAPDTGEADAGEAGDDRPSREDRERSILFLSDGAPTLPVHADRARSHALQAARQGCSWQPVHALQNIRTPQPIRDDVVDVGQHSRVIVGAKVEVHRLIVASPRSGRVELSMHLKNNVERKEKQNGTGETFEGVAYLMRDPCCQPSQGSQALISLNLPLQLLNLGEIPEKDQMSQKTSIISFQPRHTDIHGDRFPVS